jgi:predicted DNA-binding transcriptional regulator AlpA
MSTSTRDQWWKAAPSATPHDSSSPRSSTSKGETYLRFEQLREHSIFYSRSHIWWLVQQGRFPAPIAPSPNRRLWRLSEIEAFNAGAPPPQPKSKARSRAMKVVAEARLAKQRLKRHA